MAVTPPTTWPGLDPSLIQVGVDVVTDPQAVNIINAENYLWARHRMGVAIQSEVDDWTLGTDAYANGIFQGVGSTVNTDANGSTYVIRKRVWYPSRAINDNQNQLRFVTYAEVNGTGGVKLQVRTTGGTLVDTITNIHNSTGLVTGTAAGGTLDGDTDYICDISLMAASGGSGFTKLLYWGLYETRYTSLP